MGTNVHPSRAGFFSAGSDLALSCTPCPEVWPPGLRPCWRSRAAPQGKDRWSDGRGHSAVSPGPALTSPTSDCGSLPSWEGPGWELLQKLRGITHYGSRLCPSPPFPLLSSFASPHLFSPLFSFLPLSGQFLTTPDNIQALFLALSSRSIPGWLGGSYVGPGIEISALPTVP